MLVSSGYAYYDFLSGHMNFNYMLRMRIIARKRQQTLRRNGLGKTSSGALLFWYTMPLLWDHSDARRVSSQLPGVLFDTLFRLSEQSTLHQAKPDER